MLQIVFGLKTERFSEPTSPMTSRESSHYLLLCSAEERNSYRFETTWGWV